MLLIPPAQMGYPESHYNHEEVFTLLLELGWRESPMNLATFERNMPLDIIYFVIQSDPNSGRCWKAKIVHENHDSELEPTFGGTSSAASLTQEA